MDIRLNAFPNNTIISGKRLTICAAAPTYKDIFFSCISAILGLNRLSRLYASNAG